MSIATVYLPIISDLLKDFDNFCIKSIISRYFACVMLTGILGIIILNKNVPASICCVFSGSDKKFNPFRNQENNEANK